MSDDRQKLKALLLSEELAQLKAIHKLLNDKQQLTKKVSEVLDPAADMVIATNPDFQKKFSKVDPKSYVRAVKANKQTFIDALLPIIGPMIRKSVSSAIRRFVADVNRAVEMGISAKALKWRWKSFTSGVPFAEIVFNNTIEYQVQQVFLIDNHSGMLIEYVGHEEDLLQDKEAMSAMLTAIQDFVKDSVSRDGEGLSAAELGDELVWLIHGNKANIAAVIKGAPTARLRDSMSGVLEGIHLDYFRQLDDQNQWNNSPELKSELEKMLLTKTQSDDEEKSKGINYWPWLIAILAIVIWLSWSAYQHQSTKNTITEQLNQTPGFVLQDLKFEDDKFIAYGMQDPLTSFTDLGSQVEIISTPFISLQDEIVAKRVANILDQPSIQVQSNNNQVTLVGAIDESIDIRQQLDYIRLMPGVSQLSDQTTVTKTETLDDFILSNPPPHTLQVDSNDLGIVLSGVTTEESLSAYIRKLESFAPIDASAVVLGDTNELTAMINATPLKIISTQTLSDQQQTQLDQMVAAISQLSALQSNTLVKITAQSDCQGSVRESNENNQIRLGMVYDYLQSQGLEQNQMLTETITCTTTAQEVNLAMIGVWFEVVQ